MHSIFSAPYNLILIYNAINKTMPSFQYEWLGLSKEMQSLFAAGVIGTLPIPFCFRLFIYTPNFQIIALCDYSLTQPGTAVFNVHVAAYWSTDSLCSTLKLYYLSLRYSHSIYIIPKRTFACSLKDEVEYRVRSDSLLAVDTFLTTRTSRSCK